MGMDVDYVVADGYINTLHKLLSEQPHGQREAIADEIIAFVEHMIQKWGKEAKEKEKQDKLWNELLDDLEV